MKRWGSLLRDDGYGRTVHSIGLPQSLNSTEPVRLPASQAVVIQETPDGFFLVRYARNGDFAGDTWHAIYEDAISQAAAEFGDLVRGWIVIPEDEQDEIGYVRRATVREDPLES